MGLSSKIEWTEATWNPVTGCTKVSPGCTHCYAERLAHRLQGSGMQRYANGFKVTVHPDVLALPLLWKRPSLVFVDSMGDLFHDDVPFDFIARAFRVMEEAGHHTFQVLTKRAQRLAELAPRLSIPQNVWIGVSVESDDYVVRADLLRMVRCKVRFLSLEPLLGPLPSLSLEGIDWVVVGGESGPQARPMKAEWARQMRQKCQGEAVPFFFKQWGGRNRRAAGRLLDDRLWDEMPQGFERRIKTTPSTVALVPG
jgi:protein gp37